MSELFHGYQRASITGAGFLDGQRQAAAIAHKAAIDNGEAEVGFQVYVTAPRLPFKLLSKVTEFIHTQTKVKALNHIPHMHLPVTKTDITDWHRDYPRAKLEAVNAPFSADLLQEMYRIGFGEWENGALEPFMQVAWAAFFGVLLNGNAVALAEQFNVPLILHPDVIDRLQKMGKIGDVTDRISLWAEPERSHNSLNLRNDRELIYNPEAVNKRFVENGPAGGIVLDETHNRKEGIETVVYLQNSAITRTMRSLHFAGKEHKILTGHEPETQRVLQTMAQTNFSQSVSIAPDNDPRSLALRSLGQKYDMLAPLFKQIFAVRNEHK